MKYRIVTNGDKFRIQRSRFGLFWRPNGFDTEFGSSEREYPTKAGALEAMVNLIQKDAYSKRPWEEVTISQEDIAKHLRLPSEK